MITLAPIWTKKDENGRFLHKEIEHDDLLPCPFCGGKAEARLSGDSWFIICKKCFSKSGSQNIPSIWNTKKCLDSHLIKKAVKAWNKRV